MTQQLLAGLQQNFADGLLDINQAENALTAFKGDEALNRERFALYRGNLTAIWNQTLANAYPVLQQLLGADFFTGLARAYGQRYASHSGNLSEFGAELAEFTGTLDNTRDYPYLSDVAALEWQVHRAYYTQQLPPLTLTQLAAYSPEQLGSLRFRLQEGCALLYSSWANTAIWQAHLPPDNGQGQETVQTQHPPQNIVFPTPLDTPSHTLVWRDSWRVRVCQLNPASYTALHAIAAGKTLGEALDEGLNTAQQNGIDFSIPAELSEWFSKQLICDIIR